MRDVLLGPPETFRAVDNAQFSSVVRDTERKGKALDTQLAQRQHRELVAAYEDAGVTVHFLPRDEETGYQVYTRDSSFMTPYGAVVCQMANPRRRGEYAAVLRFYLEKGIPIYDLVSAGSFEGGDFNMIEPGSVLIGYTDVRSEAVAARQIARWIEREGWEVKFAPSTPPTRRSSPGSRPRRSSWCPSVSRTPCGLAAMSSPSATTGLSRPRPART
jgi:N-dimethylarginine dimethylaminohydrolase